MNMIKHILKIQSKGWWTNYNLSVDDTILKQDKNWKLPKSDIMVHKLFLWPSNNKGRQTQSFHNKTVFMNITSISGLINLNYYWTIKWNSLWRLFLHYCSTKHLRSWGCICDPTQFGSRWQHDLCVGWHQTNWLISFLLFNLTKL